MRTLIITAAIVGSLVPAGAQGQTRTPEQQATIDKITSILGIPKRAEEVRQAGVPDTTVQSVLDIMRDKKVPPQEVEEILIAERDAAREHGPTDNFGAFVQARLAEGLRGRDLAAAIKREHAARGKGKGFTKDKPLGGKADDDDKRGGRPDDAGNASKGKRPDDAGSAAKGNRPDSKPSKGPEGKRPN